MREEQKGRGKREEGRGKREEGRGKREEGRGKREEGRRDISQEGEGVIRGELNQWMRGHFQFVVRCVL
jgi:hypothetical protein